MTTFHLFAKPWWVDLLILVPIGSWFFFRGNKLSLTRKQLLIAACFGIAFGFVEASVVVYLRQALGLAASYNYEQLQLLNSLSKHLLLIEFFREIATMVMLVSVAFLAAKTPKDRWAAFLWIFAFWDIFYYAGLWATVRWPGSLLTYDVLFLIPSPWISQVWFPILVSTLSIGVVYLSLARPQARD